MGGTVVSIAEVRPGQAESAGQILRTFISSRAESTGKSYAADIKAFTVFMGETSESAAIYRLLSSGGARANEVVSIWRSNMRDAGVSASTINRRLGTLRSLTKFARARGEVSFEIARGNVRVQPYRDTSGPGIEAVRAMVAILEEDESDKGRRDLAIMRLLFDLGLRRAELVGINLCDLDLAQHVIWITSKGGDQQVKLSIPAATARALEDWIEPRGRAPGPLFLSLERSGRRGRLSATSVYRMVRTLGRRVGVETRPHGIRHTAISEAMRIANELGVPIEEVATFSRHRDTRVMLAYRDNLQNRQGELSALLTDKLSKAS